MRAITTAMPSSVRTNCKREDICNHCRHALSDQRSFMSATSNHGTHNNERETYVYRKTWTHRGSTERLTGGEWMGTDISLESADLAMKLENEAGGLLFLTSELVFFSKTWLSGLMK